MLLSRRNALRALATVVPMVAVAKPAESASTGILARLQACVDHFHRQHYVHPDYGYLHLNDSLALVQELPSKPLTWVPSKTIISYNYVITLKRGQLTIVTSHITRREEKPRSSWDVPDSFVTLSYTAPDGHTTSEYYNVDGSLNLEATKKWKRLEKSEQYVDEFRKSLDT